MKKTMIATAFALVFVSTAAMAAPQVEVTVLGGQSIFNRSDFQADGAGGTFLGDKIDDALEIDGNDLQSDFAPGLRLGVRLGDSPVLVTVGARQSDLLDLSYDAGVRLNSKGSNLGFELRARRFDDADVRAAFGDNDVDAEAVVTYDVAKYLRLGAGLTTVTLDDEAANGLITADLVFKFGGQSAPTSVTFPDNTVVPAPSAEETGERG